MEISLQGQTAVVTGAATGIGRAIAIALSIAGARVVVNHLRKRGAAQEVVDTITGAGGQALMIEADVTHEEQVAWMMAKVASELEGIDILVNNAGIMLQKPFLDSTSADWDRVMDADLRSVFLCSRQALPYMMGRSRGCIINVASELGYLGREEFALYTAAKGAVLTLTRSLAREFAPAIRINAIAPGPVDTDMLSLNAMTPDWRAKEAAIPARRVGLPTEIAATAVFLASEHASFYYGQTLSPNGGAYMP